MDTPIITRKRKSIVRAIRSGSRTNSDGSQSTHVMESGEGEGKYRYQVNPTLFQNKDGSWVDLKGSDDKLAAYKEAKSRGEVFGFKSKKRADKFAYGSWKKGKERREAMRNYRINK